MGSELQLSWETEADWDLGTVVNVDGEGGDLKLTKQNDFTETILEGSEHSGTGTLAVASALFSGKDLGGLTKDNGLLKIDLKCSDWSKRIQYEQSQLEITSSGKADSEEWQFVISDLDLDVTDDYKTFYLDMSMMGSSGGELDVENINFIRWYVPFVESETIYWRNAKIIQAYHDNGYRIGPEIDLAILGDDVQASEISWNGIQNGGDIDIKTQYSLDGGDNWSEFEDCTNGGAIPGLAGKDVSNGKLKCGQQLFTNSGNAEGYYTPELYWISIEITGKEQSINLVLDVRRSFRTAYMRAHVSSEKDNALNIETQAYRTAHLYAAKDLLLDAVRAFNMEGSLHRSKNEVLLAGIDNLQTRIFRDEGVNCELNATANVSDFLITLAKNLVISRVIDLHSTAFPYSTVDLDFNADPEILLGGLLKISKNLAMDIETDWDLQSLIIIRGIADLPINLGIDRFISGSSLRSVSLAMDAEADWDLVASLRSAANLLLNVDPDSLVGGFLQAYANLVMGIETDWDQLGLIKRTLDMPLILDLSRALWKYSWRIPSADLDRIVRPDGDWTKMDRAGGSFSRHTRPGGGWNKIINPVGDWTKE
ncbi:MAG: hypothetical protein ACLFUL_07565 [Desulfobacteraceae bacterium]